MKTHDENIADMRAARERGEKLAGRWCLYKPGRGSIIDTLYIDDKGTVRTVCFSKTIEDARVEYDNAVVMTLDDAVVEIEAVHAREYQCTPVEITEDRFMEMLNVLPPEDWCKGDICESFKLMERTCGVYTAIFCRLGNRHFELMDSYLMPHEAIIEACNKLVGRHVKNLECACCGGGAPAWEQWWNRDTGYGVCQTCFNESVEREGREAAERCYGKRWIHHSIAKNGKLVG